MNKVESYFSPNGMSPAILWMMTRIRANEFRSNGFVERKSRGKLPWEKTWHERYEEYRTAIRSLNRLVKSLKCRPTLSQFNTRFNS